jgi:hypothetical protein
MNDVPIMREHLNDIEEIYAKIGFSEWMLISKNGKIIDDNFNTAFTMVFNRNSWYFILSDLYVDLLTSRMLGIKNLRIKIIFTNGTIVKTNFANDYLRAIKNNTL